VPIERTLTNCGKGSAFGAAVAAVPADAGRRIRAAPVSAIAPRSPASRGPVTGAQLLESVDNPPSVDLAQPEGGILVALLNLVASLDELRRIGVLDVREQSVHPGFHTVHAVPREGRLVVEVVSVELE
jgi:hypothetical protein